MLSTVAVGTDGSSTAAKAVEAAAEIAQRFDAKLVLLSVCRNSRQPVTLGGRSEHQWVENPDSQMREMLDRTVGDLRDRNIDCTSMIGDGEPGEVLSRLAAQCKADVLVIGNQGMHRRVLGSVPNAVTHKAPCSVYVVKTT